MRAQGSHNQTRTASRRVRRMVLRAGLWVTGLIVALSLIGALLIAQAPVRNRILATMLVRTARALPGRLVVEDASWSALGTVSASRLCWSDGADALVSAESLAVSIALWPLLHRDLHVLRLQASAVTLDLPAVLARLPEREAATDAAGHQAPRRTSVGLLREGSLAGLPAISLTELHLSARSIRLAPDAELTDLVTEGSLDLLPDHQPRLTLRRLSAREKMRDWQLDDLRVDLDLASRQVSGQGSGSLGAGWPFYLSIQSTGADTFDLQVWRDATGASHGTGERPAFDLHATLIRCGAQVCSLSCAALIRTPGVGELTAHPMLAKRLAGWPDLEGITAELVARLQLRPLPAGRVSVTLLPNTWLEGGRVALAYEEQDLWLDTLSVRMPDLAMEAHMRIVAGQLRAAARIGARGTRWLAMLGSTRPSTDSLHADLRLSAAGRGGAIDVDAELLAAGVVGRARFDSLHVRAAFPGAADSAVTFRLSMRGMEHRLSTRGRLLRGDTLHLALDPLRLERWPLTSTGAPVGASAEIDYVPATQSLRIGAMRLTGDYGDLVLDATLAASRELSVRLRGAWPNPPCGLRDLLRADPAQWDSLRAAWRGDGPFAVDLSARGIVQAAETGGKQPQLQAQMSLKLPGPRTFGAWFPPAVKISDLGPVRGGLSAALEAGRLTMAFDLAQTAWLDTARIVALAEDRHLVLETLQLAAEGLRVEASGERVESLWNLRARLNLAGNALPRRTGAITDSLAEISLTADADFHGTLAQPHLTARAEGRWHSTALSLPWLTAEGGWDGAGAALELQAPQGLSTPMMALDSLRASYRSTTPPGALLPGELSLSAHGPRFSWFQQVHLDREDGLTVRTDTLRLTAGGRDLASRRPFAVRIDEDPPRLEIAGLDLLGSLGAAQAEGWITPDEAEITAKASLHLPRRPPGLGIAPDLWPRSCELEFKAWALGEMRGDLRFEGLRFARREFTQVHVGFETQGRELRGHAAIEDSAGVILTLQTHLPARISLYPFSAVLLEGPAHGDLHLTRFPIAPLAHPEQREVSRDRIAQIDADLLLRGTTAEPFAHALGRARFPNLSKLSRFALDFDLLLAPTSELPSEIVGHRARDHAPLAPLSEGGLSVAIALVRTAPARAIAAGAHATPLAPHGLLSGVMQLPLLCTLLPPAITMSPDRRLSLRVETHDLPLEEFDPLLPGNAGVSGKLGLLLAAEGPVGDPALEGEIDARGIRLSMADGTYLSAGAELQIAGTGRRPSVAGRVEVARGLIIIPEPPKNLHPTEGRAVLWETPAATTTAASLPPAAEDGAPATPAIAPTLDIRVEIPSGLWLRGRGLAVEMAGDLRMVHTGGIPVIAGELRAVRGHLVFLERIFQVETGRATFYGEDEINPSLDLVLATRIGGTAIQVLFQGTAQRPEISFTSDPEMEEGDIVAFLLFGRPLDELDNDQMNLLQRRATEVAASYGTAQLEARLSRQLGVDMVTIRPGGSRNGATSLIVGKYLSRRVLLRHEQALEGSAAFFVNLEYFLNRHMKIDTMVGSHSQSGIELNWATEY